MGLTSGSSLSSGAGGGGVIVKLPPLSNEYIGVVNANADTSVEFDVSNYDYDGYYIKCSGVWLPQSASRLYLKINNDESGVYYNLRAYPNNVYQDSSQPYFFVSANIDLAAGQTYTNTFNITVDKNETSVTLMSDFANTQSAGICRGAYPYSGDLNTITIYSSQTFTGDFYIYGYYLTEENA